MSDRSPSPLALGDCAAEPLVPRAAVRAYLALSAGLGATVTGLMLMLSVASNSGGEAERIADTHDDGYVLTLAAALAVNLAKPLR
ncbi:hypothetical protein [Methylobacterium sp. J-076]|uniref:hypothetical protein n=1 Tax=Methylobacterium sp. J-076 TaxID=2836655 RepID=UPI001FBB313D|nr:hypothetical protein [Methylobacterium sp. J-076]MCJ2012970.1 hypothetical protein [Methylobacterium sp. J-076]